VIKVEVSMDEGQVNIVGPEDDLIVVQNSPVMLPQFRDGAIRDDVTR
jgi:hypothetical protein